MIFITGGARSGKSDFAEQLAREGNGSVTYIATAAAGDEEMQSRIALHRGRRPSSWKTLEVESGLAGELKAAAGEGTVLVDCLTLYLSNRLLSGDMADAEARLGPVEREIDELAGICGDSNGDIIIVSNEVGMGIVPENALARAFRDVAGKANQRMAAAAEEVYLCVSGIPVKVK